MFKFYDDLIYVENQENIKNELMGGYFPWFYHTGTVSPREREIFKNNPIQSREIDWFCHRFVVDGEETDSNQFYLIKKNLNPILTMFSESFGFKLWRCQANLVPPSGNFFDRRHTSWHIDYPEDHTVLIYYVNDSPARTLFREGGSVEPKQGRCLVFDGKHYHSAHIPKKETRCVINFNFVKI